MRLRRFFGWVAALRDQRLGRVILAIHNKPGHDWTLAELPGVMGASPLGLC